MVEWEINAETKKIFFIPWTIVEANQNKDQIQYYVISNRLECSGKRVGDLYYWIYIIPHACIYYMTC